MRTFRNSFFLLAITCCLPAIAQQTLKGVIVDANSREPLAFANIYVNFTTIGTTAGEDGAFTLDKIPPGEAEIIFSFVGHKEYKLKVNERYNFSEPVTIKLLPIDLKEVVVSDKKDERWEAQLTKFNEAFLGKSVLKLCHINNPWVLEFSQAGETLNATAGQPLEIQNEYLGYDIVYTLQHFSSTPNEYLIEGNARYREMNTPDPKLAEQWAKRRDEAYHGSVMHLFKSIIDGTTEAEGFKIYKDLKHPAPMEREAFFSGNFPSRLQELDPTTIVKKANQPGYYMITLPSLVEVHFRKRRSPAVVYKDVMHSVSWIENTHAYLVNEAGAIMNPTGMIRLGEMSKTKVGEALPRDYSPDKKEAVKNVRVFNLTVPEKVELQTDKFFYFPGERIWFKSFFQYPRPELADSLSRVLHVEIYREDGSFFSHNLFPIQRAMSFGDVALRASVPPGKYFLRAYTMWSLNFGQDYTAVRSFWILPLTQEADDRIQVADVRSGIFLQTKSSAGKFEMDISLDEPEKFNGANVSVSVVNGIVPVSDFSRLDDKLSGQPTSLNKYQVERGLNFQGRLLNLKGKPETGRITVVHSGLADFYAAHTFLDGSFRLDDLFFYDSSEFHFQGKTLKGKIGRIVIEQQDADKFIPPKNVDGMKTRPSSQVRENILLDTIGSTTLQEVTIEGKRIDHESKSRLGSVDVVLDRQAISADNRNTLRGLITGLQLVPITFEGKVVYLLKFSRSIQFLSNQEYYSTEVSLYIDGMPIAGPLGYKAKRFLEIRPSEVDRIEIFKPNGGGGRVFGAAGNGIIAIYTVTSGDGDMNKFNLKDFQTIKLCGYSQQHEFPPSPSPWKELKGSTVYWNPDVIIDDSGRSRVSFEWHDDHPVFTIVVEGMTTEGKPIRAVKYFSSHSDVEEPVR